MRTLRRAGLGLADQALYSLSNFVLTVLVARSVSPAAFGAYALIASSYLIGFAVSRGLTSETFVVRYSSADSQGQQRSRWQYGASSAAGLAVVIGTVLGLVTLAVGLVLIHSHIGPVAIVFGVTLPFLILQDFYRYAALALGRPGLALVNDGVAAVVQFGCSAAVIVTHHSSSQAFVAAWGIGAVVGAAVGSTTMHVGPRVDRIWYWFDRYRDVAVRYAVDDAINQGSQQANGFIVAAVGGLTETAGLRAAQTVFGPPSILNLGVMTSVTPELVRILRRRPGRLPRVVLLVGAAAGLLGLAWGVAALLVPDRLGVQLFGATWPLAQPLLGYFVVAQCASGLRIGPMAGLRALADPRRTLRARWWVTGSGLAATTAGALLGGAMGVAVALAVITPVQTVLWWVFFRSGMRAHLAARAAGDPPPPLAPEDAADPSEASEASRDSAEAAEPSREPRHLAS